MCYATAVRARSREAGFPVFVRNVHDGLLQLRSGAVLHVDGPSGGFPVLFLHGMGGGAWSWKPQRDALSATYRLFVWEARGHGSAPRVNDAGVEDYYADAREALAAVLDDARRPAIVVGHSLGGLLAMRLACDVAGGEVGLFLIEPGYEMFGKTPIGAAATVLGPLTGALTKATLRSAFARTFEHRERMEEAWPDQAGQVPFEYPRFFRDVFAGAKGFEVRDFAKDIHDPTFLLEGSRVPRTLRRGIRRLAETLRAHLGEDFHHETVFGGHYLQLDVPDTVNSLLRRFLEKRL
jgi:pimeloyl-ACP methyl ester carboxylesterase